MGQASKVHDDPTWDLEETVRQVEQKFATDLKKNNNGGNDKRREVTENTILARDTDTATSTK